MNLVDELHAIAAALEDAGITYAVCGGVAVTIHGHVRNTKDIDILVSRDDLARALEAVRPVGFQFVAGPMTFERGTGRERHVQRVSKIDGTEHVMLDLLVAEASLAGALDDRVQVTLPAGTLSVVSRSTLIHLKRLAGRPQDLADVERLESPDAG